MILHFMQLTTIANYVETTRLFVKWLQHIEHIDWIKNSSACYVVFRKNQTSICSIRIRISSSKTEVFPPLLVY